MDLRKWLSLVLLIFVLFSFYLVAQHKQNAEPEQVPKYQILQIIDCIDDINGTTITISYVSDIPLPKEIEYGYCTSAWEAIDHEQPKN